MYNKVINNEELINTQERGKRREGLREIKIKFSWQRVPIMPSLFGLANKIHPHSHRQTQTNTQD